MKYAIVPVEATEEMHRAALDDKKYYRGLKQSYADVLAASPNGGKVTKQQTEQMRAVLKPFVYGPLGNAVVIDMLEILGLEVGDE